MSGDNFLRRYSVVAETRRRWSEAEKQAIVAEAARRGANISAVARRHGIKPSLLFRWRRLAREAGEGRAAGPVFMPVTLALPSASVKAPVPEAATISSAMPPSPASEAAQHCTDNRIEIELGNGRLVRVGAGVDTATLQRILDVLERR